MARRRRKGYRSSSGMTLDLTELKLGAMLFKRYGGGPTIQKALNKDVSGAIDTYGTGDIVGVLMDSTIAGGGAKLRRKIGMYVQPIKSKFFKLRL